MGKKNKIEKENIDSNINEEVKVFEQFKRQKLFSQVAFVFAALVVGFGINSFVLNGKYGNQLKTSIVDSGKIIEKKSDIYIEASKDSNRLKINIGKNMKQVKSLSFSIMYNPEEITVLDIFPKIKGVKLSRIENEKGVSTLILNFEDSQDIKSFTNIIEVYVSKKTEKTTQNINIINSNFTDGTGTNYELNTSGIIF